MATRASSSVTGVCDLRVLSVNESASTAAEADRICALATGSRAALLALKSGESTHLDGFGLRCLDADKNVILEIDGQARWYLKYSRQDEWLMREIAGAEALARCIGDVTWYQHPPAIRASLEHRYTLYGRVIGRSFNATVLSACIGRRHRVRDEAASALRNLGEAFARLHRFDGPDFAALNPTTASHVERYLARLGATTPILKRIASLLDNVRAQPGPPGWIHANVKSEDIFINGSRVALIDFGTCGRGAIDEDLCNLCAYLLVLRTVPCFPWKFSTELVRAFISGYLGAGTLNATSLARQVGLAVCLYYLKNAGIESRLPTLSGLPVLKTRLESLVNELVDGSNHTIFI